MSDHASPPSYYTGSPSAGSSRSTLHAPVDEPASAPGVGDQSSDVMLTWDAGDEIQGAEQAVRALTIVSPSSASSSPPPSLPPRTPSPLDRPPEYVQAARPTRNVVYTFSPIAHNAMVLVPPARAPDTRPRYYIAVRMNCFAPLSHVTAIYRGAGESDAQKVAEFEMGIADAPSRVQVGRAEGRAVEELLSRVGRRTNGTYTWILPSARGPMSARPRVRWDCSQAVCICTTAVAHKTVLLAKFLSHMGPSMQYAQSRLEVTPAGHDMFDDVLLALMVVKRTRLSPGGTTSLKALFN